MTEYWKTYMWVLAAICGVITAVALGTLRHNHLPSATPTWTVQTDPATGCDYLIYRSTITPRRDAAGKQVCSSTTK